MSRALVLTSSYDDRSKANRMDWMSLSRPDVRGEAPGVQRPHCEIKLEPTIGPEILLHGEPAARRAVDVPGHPLGGQVVAEVDRAEDAGGYRRADDARPAEDGELVIRHLPAAGPDPGDAGVVGSKGDALAAPGPLPVPSLVLDRSVDGPGPGLADDEDLDGNHAGPVRVDLVAEGGRVAG